MLRRILVHSCNQFHLRGSFPADQELLARLPRVPRSSTITAAACSVFDLAQDPIMANSFNGKGTLTVDGQDYSIYRLAAVAQKYPQVQRLPFSLKILLENLLRTEDGINVRADDIAALAQWDAKA